MRIFLSYGHDKNEPLVLLIKDRLEGLGFEIWIDQAQIKAGNDWRLAITEGVLSSEVFLSFLSKHSSRSPGVCLDEIGIALGLNAAGIQTILVEEETEVCAPSSISHIQWLDMHEWASKQAEGDRPWANWFDQKVETIADTLGNNQGRYFKGEIAELEQHLKPISSDSRILKLINKGLVGRSWVMDEIEAWRKNQNSTSQVFWITGSPGVGKSAIAAHLAHYGRDKVIAVQFCEWDKPEFANAGKVIKSLSFQIAARLPDYRRFLLSLPEIADVDSLNSSELFEYLLVNPLNLLIDGGRDRYIVVIDGIDEASKNGRNELAEILARQQGGLPRWLGVVITSRSEKSVTVPLQSLNAFMLDDNGDRNSEDILAYFRNRLGNRLSSLDNIDQFEARLVHLSAGVFLYAELFCDDVDEGVLSLEDTQNFPRGMGGFYWQYFARIFPNPDKYAENARSALSVLIAAIDPVPVDVLQSLFAWSKEEIKDFSRTAGSLFPTTTESGIKKIRPFHKSLVDWLADEDLAGLYYASQSTGHSLLADAGWAAYQGNTLNTGDYLLDHLPRHISSTANWGRLLELLADSNLNLFAQWIDHGDFESGRDCLRGLLKHLTSTDNSSTLVPTIASQLARIESRTGDLSAAQELLEMSIKSPASSLHPKLEAICLHELASIRRERGNTRAARQGYRQALKIARRVEPPLMNEVSANLLALAASYQTLETGWRRAHFLAQAAVAISFDVGDSAHELEGYRILADIGKDRMEFSTAEQCVESALKIAQTRTLPYAEMSLLTVLGWLQYQRDAINDRTSSDSMITFQRLEKLAVQRKHHRFRADAWTGIGQNASYANDMGTMSSAICMLNSLMSAQSSHHIGIRLLLLRAGVLMSQTEFEQAHALYSKSANSAGDHGLVAREVDSLVGMGMASHLRDDPVSGNRNWAEARTRLNRCCPTRRELVLKSIQRFSTNSINTPL